MKTLRLYTHPDCERCARLARLHHRFDWLGRLEHTTRAPRSGPLRLGQVVAEDIATSKLLIGHEAIQALCRTIPAYRLFLPLFRLRAVRQSIDRQVAGCTDDACTLHA